MADYYFVDLIGRGSVDQNVVGVWTTSDRSLSLDVSGRFVDTDAFGIQYTGTYTTDGANLILRYANGTITRFQYSQAGNRLRVADPNNPDGSFLDYSYSSVPTDDLIAYAETLTLAKVEGSEAKLIEREIQSGVSGTGFIVSPDGYIVTNAHVVLVDSDLNQMLIDSLGATIINDLYSEFAQRTQMSEEDKVKLATILYYKIIEYFLKHGELQDVTTRFQVIYGVPESWDDLDAISWNATLKKHGEVYTKIDGEDTWGRDVAILKVEQDYLPTVTLGDSNKVQIGDSIFVIGFPGVAITTIFEQEDLVEPTVTQGVVSARKTLLTGVEAIQTDAEILPGNSGGPAYNLQGEVVGIATFGVEEGIGVNYLLPINLAKEFLRELNVETEQGVVDKVYKEGLEAFWNKECHTTVEKMETALTLHPDHPYAHEYITTCNRAIAAGEIPSPLDEKTIHYVIMALLAVIALAATIVALRRGGSGK